ncbi:S-adenosyl-L-methionine-dependent methyltransferase [Gigaspora margarita]|uniref:S-adenosyl-L-methionine-dependent methyltransferase n=1 Tax=Gigaspora margarita TaxID=4874 RepID=A0A8H4B3G3_GIGMA|nr:S-adenosyl-L-methionine-dependent methyltransferase [Gigaspora margarita]
MFNLTNKLDSSDNSESDTYNDTLLDSFRFINGRRYHNDSEVSYSLPNDEDEADRLNFQHSLLKYAWQGNHSSPVQERLTKGKARVLDVGCGTGKWLLEMSRDYQDSTFIGLDISPMFPDPSETPSNVAFLQCNVNDGIPFPDNTFDFVFQRFFSKYVTAEQWEDVTREIVRVTKPGGWIEFFEDDIEYEEIDHFGLQILNAIFAAIEAKKGNPHPTAIIPPILQTIPELSNIHHKKVPIPIGKWGGKLVTSTLNISNEIHEDICEVVAQGFDINKVSSVTHRWFAQKKTT